MKSATRHLLAPGSTCRRASRSTVAPASAPRLCDLYAYHYVQMSATNAYGTRDAQMCDIRTNIPKKSYKPSPRGNITTIHKRFLRQALPCGPNPTYELI